MTSYYGMSGRSIARAERREADREADKGFECCVCHQDCPDGSGLCDVCFEADLFAAEECRREAGVDRQTTEDLDRAAGIGEG